MADELELAKVIAGLGGGGALAVWALLELRGMRREQGEAAEKMIDWLFIIHQRLSSLGADSIPPPVARERPRRKAKQTSRYRYKTAPVGWPVTKPSESDE